MKKDLMQAYGSTHLGLVRDNNEDQFLIGKNPYFYAIADGMGGLPYGEVASKLVIDFLRDKLPSPPTADTLRALLTQANEHIYKAGALLNPQLGIGTTLTVAIPLDDTLLIGHIGDSALYTVKGTELTRLTQPHTLAHSAPKNTPIPEHYKNILTRCLGQRSPCEVDIFTHPLKGRFLLCTDGIWGVLDPKTLATLISQAPSPKHLCEALITATLAAGAPDNATAVAFFSLRGTLGVDAAEWK